MSASRLVVVGASGHAKVVLDAIERADEHVVVGLVDDAKPTTARWYGYPVLGGTAELPALVAAHGVTAFFVAIGDGTVRARVTDRVQSACPELALATVVHPAAVLARGVTLGPGAVVMAGAVIQADTRIGESCIVNTRASIDHDGVLEAYASLAPGATLGGGVQVGRYAFVGVGASVIHGRRVGAHAVVGAGAAVIDDVPERAVSVGVPARVVRMRFEGEPNL